MFGMILTVTCFITDCSLGRKITAGEPGGSRKVIREVIATGKGQSGSICGWL
jgi:hypothetical protein